MLRVGERVGAVEDGADAALAGDGDLTAGGLGDELDHLASLGVVGVVLDQAVTSARAVAIRDLTAGHVAGLRALRHVLDADDVDVALRRSLTDREVGEGLRSVVGDGLAVGLDVLDGLGDGGNLGLSHD